VGGSSGWFLLNLPDTSLLAHLDKIFQEAVVLSGVAIPKRIWLYYLFYSTCRVATCKVDTGIRRRMKIVIWSTLENEFSISSGASFMVLHQTIL
jgi:hypothetical protein